MRIGGGKLVEFQLRQHERLLMQSQHDVEEISRYAQSLNPLQLFWRGSTFELGRLFLTDERLLLLPYNAAEVDRAHLLQDVGYKVLDKIGLGIPQPKIEFTEDPLVIELDEVTTLNPYRRQFGVHPTLSVLTINGSYRFKLVPGESPEEWARAICDLTGSDISRSA